MRFFFSLLALLSTFPTLGAEVDFNRDVRPILSDKCFKCHGPDATNQKSDFRIDTFEHATEDLGDYAGIVPGNLKESETHWRIHSTDKTDIMPPPEAKMKLTKREIEILDQWILDGAEYEDHWSFVPVPKSVPVPEADWGNNEIDAFVFQKLQSEDMSPSPEVSREKWLRRVTFDLTGLPPTLAELDAFLADTAPDAHEKVIDRLFQTDAYAERMTAEWLNVARYSDTYGFQQDRDRYVWPWRDWVIGAFRNNLGYDDFITWQLAGDLLPNATDDQILATTFSRLHSQKVEGGSVPEEFRIEYIADRVHTYGTAFLGLTMECCRCHDHKYDPITAKDYYQLSAFFDKIDEAGLYSYFNPDAAPPPTLWLPNTTQKESLATVQKRITELETRRKSIEAEATSLYEEWLTTTAEYAQPSPIAGFSFDEVEKNQFENIVEKEKPAKTSNRNSLSPGKFGQAVKLTGDDAVTLPIGNFTRDDSFSISLWMNTPDVKKRAVVFSRSKAWTDAASRGYELLLEDGKLSAALIHFYPGNAIRVRAKETFPVKQWAHVTLTYDGSSRASGLSLFVDGKKIETEVVRDKLTREITGGGSDTIVIGQRMRDNGFTNGLVDDFHVYDLELSPAEVSAIAETREVLKPDLPAYLRAAHSDYKATKAKLTAARKERSELVKKIPEIMVMRKTEDPVQSHFLERGHYANKGEPVEPGTPKSLPAMPEGAPRDRLGLAQWTTADNNPLTARVTVNRYWQMLFGRGLVTTSEDFGNQGRLPSHPELLDWLARDFVSHGWDVQRLLKKILLSSTYRQESHIASGEYASRDPDNELLYRYPAPRLPAEMIRDNALAVSGLLARKTGGPPVKPYDIAVSFKPSKIGRGDELYRRSLYTYWKQTAPAPLMTTLNASKRDVCRVRLEKTDTPLQGLVLFNAPQFAEASRTLAAKLVEKHGENNDAIIAESFRWLTSRKPDETELSILKQLLSDELAHFSSKPKDAKTLIQIGDSAPPQEGNTPRVAAVTALVSTLFNFDECITKR